MTEINFPENRPPTLEMKSCFVTDTSALRSFQTVYTACEHRSVLQQQRVEVAAHKTALISKSVTCFYSFLFNMQFMVSL